MTDSNTHKAHIIDPDESAIMVGEITHIKRKFESFRKMTKKRQIRQFPLLEQGQQAPNILRCVLKTRQIALYRAIQ
jgi:hypothetical protein